MAFAEISLQPPNCIGNWPRGNGVEPPVMRYVKLAPDIDGIKVRLGKPNFDFKAKILMVCSFPELKYS